MHRIFLFALTCLISCSIESASSDNKENHTSSISTIVYESFASDDESAPDLTVERDNAMKALMELDQQLAGLPRLRKSDEQEQRHRSLSDLSEKLTFALLSPNGQELSKLCSELEPLLNNRS